MKIYNNKIIIRNLLLVLSINLKSNKINIKKGKREKFWILPIDDAIVLNSIHGGALVLKSDNMGPSPFTWGPAPLHEMFILARERYRTAKRSLRSKNIGLYNITTKTLNIGLQSQWTYNFTRIYTFPTFFLILILILFIFIDYWSIIWFRCTSWK